MNKNNQIEETKNLDNLSTMMKCLKKEYDILFNQFEKSLKENANNMEILEKKNVYIFRLENKNFIYEESIQEKDKIIKKKNEEITKYKQKILEQKELLKEVYLMLENQNKK